MIYFESFASTAQQVGHLSCLICELREYKKLLSDHESKFSQSMKDNMAVLVPLFTLSLHPLPLSLSSETVTLHYEGFISLAKHETESRLLSSFYGGKFRDINVIGCKRHALIMFYMSTPSHRKIYNLFLA